MSQLGRIEIPFERLGRGGGRIRSLSPDMAVVPQLGGLHGSRCASRAIPVGAQITVVAESVPVGWGEPVYDRLDADIAYAMMGINAVKGVEIGAGFASDRPARQRARRRTDAGGFPEQQRRRHSGRHFHRAGHRGAYVAIKPTSSIRARRGVPSTRPGNAVIVETHGRHDPCVGIRATPIAEAMLALVLIDHALRHRAQCGDVAMQPRRRFQVP